MDVQITPGPLTGTIEAISSKSELHRMLICAAFADRPTEIRVSGSAYDGSNELPNDILATLGCLNALGTPSQILPGTIRITPAVKNIAGKIPLLDCGESGSTFRFLLPVAAAFCGEADFRGSGRLPKRPIGELADALRSHGVTFTSDTLPFRISGKPAGGIYEIPGNISSQYLTGLLLMLPLLEGGAEIRLTTALASTGYIDITSRVMEAFCVQVLQKDNCWTLAKSRRYKSPEHIAAGGDWSNSAAFLTASMLRVQNDIVCQSLQEDSPQGDRKLLGFLEDFGADISITANGISASANALHGTAIDIDETPDLLPCLAVAACAADGRTDFFNAGRLRLKESDRIESTAALIRALGGNAETEEERLIIHGTGSLTGGIVDSANDHRIVMAAAIAASICKTPVIIQGAEAVNKSYPTFFDDFKALKGVCHVL